MWRTWQVAVGVVGVLIGVAGRAEDWPAWRGAGGDGVSAEAKFPTKWSATENIRWKVALPGPGNSTPIVAGGRVFVSCAAEQGHQRSLLCLDRANGKQLWTKTVTFAPDEPTHSTNPFCSASPVTDGERVIVSHGSAGLFCYNFAGEELWHRDLGEFKHVWGNAASPVLFEKLVILSCGPGLNAFVIALDKKTGQDVWRQDIPEMKSAKLDEFHGSWSTPVLYRDINRPTLLLSLPTRLFAVDPRSGATIWSCGGLSKLVYTSPLVVDDIIVTMCGYHGPALAVRAGGEGDVTESRRLWLTEKPNPQRIGSGVVVGKHVYILNENGVAWCIDPATGETKWEQRAGQGKSWSSMNYAAGRLYVINMDGTTVVLDPDPTQCKIIAENPLGEQTCASLAFSNGEIFARTYKHVYCIGEGAGD